MVTEETEGRGQEAGDGEERATNTQCTAIAKLDYPGVVLPGVRIKPDIVRFFDCVSGQDKRYPACPAFGFRSFAKCKKPDNNTETQNPQ
ncbi:hypothetical protein EVAR_79952_1 [Eumeta japonica]|uniref:Uncharacterized protein n=1 Tax=Eumeta variegata TaxID=151549 RepID=A0A4C1Y5A2_EUMVA|nr:hypothetical protein EVAR_79952_1 [Eumeta japonica]